MQREILTALIGFQSECPIIGKNKKGYGYKYADFSTIIETIQPLLKKHGLAHTHLIIGNNIKSVLCHVESAQTIESIIEIPEVQLKGMNQFQVLGSAITYLKRYALISLLGIATDDDNDAAGKEEQPKPKATKVVMQKAQEYVVNGGNVDQILKKYDLTDEQRSTLKSLTEKFTTDEV